jgi:hypothetical protein
LEIWSFLRLSARRILVLVLIVIIAVAAAVTLVRRQAPHYKATAIVFLAQTLSGGSTQFSIDPVAAGYESDLSLPSVRGQTAQQLGVSPSRLGSVAVAHASGDPNVILVVDNTSRALAAQVAQRLASVGLATVASQDVRQNEQVEQQAVVAFQTAQLNLTRYAKKTGVPDVDAALNAVSSQVLANQASGSSAIALAQAQARYTRLIKLQPEYDLLLGLRTSAQQNLSSAQASLAAARSQSVAVTQPGNVTLLGSARVSRSTALLRAGAGAGVVATILVLVVMGLFEFRRRARQPEEVRARHSRTSLDRPSLTDAVGPARPALLPGAAADDDGFTAGVRVRTPLSGLRSSARVPDDPGPAAATRD